MIEYVFYIILCIAVTFAAIGLGLMLFAIAIDIIRSR